MSNSSNEVWEKIGDIPDDEVIHVLTKLFLVYEELVKQNPENQEALNFFKYLDNAIEQTNQCNLNRR